MKQLNFCLLFIYNVNKLTNAITGPAIIYIIRFVAFEKISYSANAHAVLLENINNENFAFICSYKIYNQTN